MTYLRHGLRYYHINAQIGAEMDGPIRHLFPFAPLAIHEEWIAGRERTVTTVSGRFSRRQTARPHVRCFDARGKALVPNADVTGGQGQWVVDLRLHDRAEVSVIT
ncbi:MAG: hypothetical protein ACT4P6_02515 [Gemmatimonadaceae bacterium]